MTRLSAFVGAALALASLTARADPEGDAAPAPPVEAAPADKVKVTAIAMAHPDVDDATMVEVLRALDNGLKQNPRLEMKDIDTRLADFAQEVPQDQIDAARQALKDGEQAITEGNSAVATPKLDQAVSLLAKVLPYIKKQELADAMAMLAIARYQGGDKAGGRRDFLRLLVWRPDYQYDPSKLPPAYLDNFSEAQNEAGKLKRGVLKIGSDPAGAMAYVDGAYKGVTPCVVDNLAAGEHFVTLKKEGFKKAVQPATVSGKKDQKVDVQLAQNEKYLLIQQAIEGLDKTLGGEQAPPEMNAFREALFIDQAIFIRVKANGADKLDIDSYLYDLRTKIRLSHIAKTVAKAAAEAELASLAPSLYLNVNYSGELALPVEKLPDKPKERPPLYKTWWFWASAGAVLVGVIGVSIAIASTRGVACPDGDLCPVIKY